MPFRNSLAAIGEKVDSPSADSDIDSTISLPTTEGFEGRASSSLQGRRTRSSHVRSSDPEAVLALTDDVLGVARGLFALVDAKYAEEELLEVQPAGDEFEVADCLDDARCLNDVTAAKKKLNYFKARLRIAKAQAVVAENRLKTAQAQVAFAEDRVNLAIDQLESALGK
ncbi:hypothetical protein G647_06435 [Cladophialophora carrionii CBS 160.54]|uniref:Uncharacterized protein n=1 Tax=Cladophialophora carrionii CBS 160.54 TaxID=1279043 RepID=V9D6V8_9EURO|nr:uncharacterized protein G647_06435 [Cladophialophora carrionii CBS 160.54]ETI22361.1 hypothetical protein G647_06435 [Cladophialophora carrionii CBS 160.54]